ncbi:hypothetical protein D1646_16300 [Pseudoflavonifractor sp. 60]|uniref:hypothetical protein n=1 Tax=Pseudoflavonifractor sp. 60 TaxID=2304576 RepID=UPI00137131CA|nr:hypothetical protein [Pseudoflavonifractor sp. 60]NBI68332.1 hypothetical protein [Pseudoflavonifractor sp. 60]
MKKLLAFILAAALALSLVACGGGGDGGRKEVELTADNIEDYLSLSLETSNLRAHNILGTNFGSLQDITISAYAVQGGSFNNVQITFEIPLPTLGSSVELFTVAESDDAYDENNETTLTLTVRLPANGEFSEVHTVGSSLSYNLDDYDIEYMIKEISGTFAPN